jgi:LysM repeat protein
MALFLGGALLAGDFLFIGAVTANADKGVLGGPVRQVGGNSSPALTTLMSQSVIAMAGPVAPVDVIPSDEYSSDARLTSLMDTLPGVNVNALPVVPITYIVKKGDTLSKVASLYGISSATITGANPNLKKRSLRVGEKLIVPGFKGTNNITGELDGNSVVVQADIAHATSPTERKNAIKLAQALPSLPGYFAMPAKGFNWGQLHDKNAVDIANSCGTPVLASAEGLVVADPDLGSGESGWNGGYGLFVLLEHPNGVKTRYAHLEQVLVSPGDYVKQGQQLGTMGETGHATGCHVHFEVLGAKNPFAKS